MKCVSVLNAPVSPSIARPTPAQRRNREGTAPEGASERQVLQAARRQRRAQPHPKGSPGAVLLATGVRRDGVQTENQIDAEDEGQGEGAAAGGASEAVRGGGAQDGQAGQAAKLEEMGGLREGVWTLLEYDEER